jgi:hypothetical protein
VPSPRVAHELSPEVPKHTQPQEPKAVQRSAPSSQPDASKAVFHHDAPMSAVNAGDRRVAVHYKTSEISLPVTPSTTAKDLLNSASIVLSSCPDPRSAVLLESFTNTYLNLERPLRRYERIRDVMNSWDTDTQNHLFILSSAECSARGLDFKDVPATTASKDITLQMHHSARPGRWDKRWVRLRSDGQITVSKHESGSDSTNICHLSDFDLYAPTPTMLKRLRAPKKTVFAVKSQQKSAMFLSGDDNGQSDGALLNYTHFFASASKDTADLWYAAVHSWRSWYLVNVLGEGRVPAQGTGEVLGARNADLTRRSDDADPERPGTSSSHGTVPYQLGSFKPLAGLDFSDFGKGEAPQLGRRPSVAAAGAGQHARSKSTTASSPARSGPPRSSFDGNNNRASPRTRRIDHGRAPAHAQTGLILEATNANAELASSSSTSNRVPGPVSPADNTSANAFTGKGLLASLDPSSLTSAPSTGFEDSSAGFTGKGLLARSATNRAQGGRGTGRGVGGTAGKGKPLVDLSAESEFEDGSLLRKLEGRRG